MFDNFATRLTVSFLIKCMSAYALVLLLSSVFVYVY